jgi:hypothetical protein
LSYEYGIILSDQYRLSLAVGLLVAYTTVNGWPDHTHFEAAAAEIDKRQWSDKIPTGN